MDELFEKIIFHALKRHATDVHMKIDQQLDIEFRVLGRLEHYASYEIDIGHKIMNYIKYKSFINVNYKLVPQTGAFHYFIDNISISCAFPFYQGNILSRLLFVFSIIMRN